MTKEDPYFEGQLLAKLLRCKMDCSWCHGPGLPRGGLGKPGERSLRGLVLKAAVSDASCSLRTEPRTGRFEGGDGTCLQFGPENSLYCRTLKNANFKYEYK